MIERGYYNASEAATYLSKSRSYIHKLTKTGKLEGYLPLGGRRKLYRKEDLDDLMLKSSFVPVRDVRVTTSSGKDQ